MGTLITEESHGAHPYTVGWWRELPEAFRVADRAQGEVLAGAWDGLNRDPRFVMGFDGWERANTSRLDPYLASISLSRSFQVTPGVPVLIRSWHTPADTPSGITADEVADGVYRMDALTTEVSAGMFTLDGPRSYVMTPEAPEVEGTVAVGNAPERAPLRVVETAPGVYEINGTAAPVSVRHTVTDYAGAVIVNSRAVVVGSRHAVDTWVTPDRFGWLHVVVEVSVPAPGGQDLIDALHVGTRAVSFAELPDAASFTMNKPYPLLRYMDGIGHQVGFLADEASRMWEGATFDPVTAPRQWLRFLGTVMGLPRTYMDRLSAPQLRSHLVAFAESGRPPIGSRRNIAEVAKQWLTGDRQVTVIPASQLPAWSSTEDDDLLRAVNGATSSGEVLVSPSPPIPATEYRWAGERGVSASTLLTRGVVSAENLETNPGFYRDLSGWTTARCAAVRDTKTFQGGAASVMVTPAVDADDKWYLIAGSRSYKATATVATTMWVMSRVRRAVALRVWGYGGAPTVQGSTVSLVPGVWTPVTMRYQVTPGATYRPALVPASGDATADPLWVDRVYTARKGYEHTTYFDGDGTDSSARDLWVRPGSPNTLYRWDAQARWVAASATQGLVDAVVESQRGTRSVYTLLMFVRADELPNRDIPAFRRFMQDSGVIPAGYRLVCLESRSTWEQWENAVGATWADLESRTETWTDSESAGVALDY